MEDCKIIIRDADLNILLKGKTDSKTAEKLEKLIESADSVVSVKYTIKEGTSLGDFEKAFSNGDPYSVSSLAELTFKMKANG